MMNRAAALAVLTAALVLAPAGAANAGSNAKRCTAKGAKTVVKNKYVRVFKTPPGADSDSDTIARLFGCIYSNGRRVFLDQSYDDDYVSSSSFGKVRLNGRFVAWEHENYDISCKADCPPGYQATTLTVRAIDLRSRRQAVHEGAVLNENLVVGRGGTPAWLEQAGGGAVEVHAGSAVLDSGPIDAFALNGSTLSWTNAGQPKSATLR